MKNEIPAAHLSAGILLLLYLNVYEVLSYAASASAVPSFRHDKKDINAQAHDGRDRRAAAGDCEDQVGCCEHRTDDGEDERGLCLAGVICRTAGDNAASKREGTQDEHRAADHKHKAAGHTGFCLIHGNDAGSQQTAACESHGVEDEKQCAEDDIYDLIQ